jgi:hypothetical protein
LKTKTIWTENSSAVARVKGEDGFDYIILIKNGDLL